MGTLSATMGERATIAKMADDRVRAFLEALWLRAEESAPDDIAVRAIVAKLAALGFLNRRGNPYDEDAVWRWCRGDTVLPSDVMMGLATAYGMSIDEYLDPGARDLAAELDELRARVDIAVCVLDEIAPDLAERLSGARTGARSATA